MQRPLNHGNRRKAFLFFLLFFVITTVVVGATVFMSVQVPYKQIEKLNAYREELNAYKQRADEDKAFAEKFGREVNVVRDLLDTLNSEEVDTVLTAGNVSKKIQDLVKMIPDTTTTVNNFYHDVVTTLSDFDRSEKELRKARKELGEAINKDATQTKLNDKVQDLERRLLVAERSLQKAEVDLKFCQRDLAQAQKIE